MISTLRKFPVKAHVMAMAGVKVVSAGLVKALRSMPTTPSASNAPMSPSSTPCFKAELRSPGCRVEQCREGDVVHHATGVEVRHTPGHQLVPQLQRYASAVEERPGQVPAGLHAEVAAGVKTVREDRSPPSLVDPRRSALRSPFGYQPILGW